MYHTLVCFLSFLFQPSNCLPCLVLGFHMSTFSLPYIGFADGSSRSTRNLASDAWEIYSPTDKLINLHGIFLGCATNNIAEYSAVIELLTDAISLGIRHLIARINSQLVVLQLRNIYSIRNPMLLWVYLRIHLLERNFDYIEYKHIPRYLNKLIDALANYILDTNLRHL